MALKIKYDLSETNEFGFFNKAGVYQVKIHSVELNENNDEQLIFTFTDKAAEKSIKSYVMYTGKGAFVFRNIAEAIGKKLKTDGNVDVETWVGKILEVALGYTDDSEYIQVLSYGKKGTLEMPENYQDRKPSEDDEIEVPADILDDELPFEEFVEEDDFEDDFEDEEEEEEEVEEKPKKVAKKKATKKAPKKKAKKVVEPEIDEDEEDDDDWD